jgi:hypothetical protein
MKRLMASRWQPVKAKQRLVDAPFFRAHICIVIGADNVIERLDELGLSPGRMEVLLCWGKALAVAAGMVGFSNRPGGLGLWH